VPATLARHLHRTTTTPTYKMGYMNFAYALAAVPLAFDSPVERRSVVAHAFPREPSHSYSPRSALILGSRSSMCQFAQSGGA
jgi:hypothetical protein